MAEPASQSAPRSSQSWRLLTALFILATFLEVAFLAHFILFTPAFLTAIGLTQGEINAWTGPIASAAFLSGIWFVPFWGVFADRYGRKPLILRSYYVEVLAMAFAAISQNVWFYLFARALTGLALGNTGLMYAALTEVAPRNRVALALSLINGSGPLGALVGALAGGFLVTAVGVHFLFGIDALVAALIAAILTLFYKETFTPKPTPRITVMLRDAIGAVVHTPVAVTIFAVSFVYSAGYYFSYTYLPVRIGEIVGELAAPEVIGITQGIAGGATLAGSAILGALADRAGHRRLLIVLMLIAGLLWLPLYAAQGIVSLTIIWTLMAAVSPVVSSLMITIISVNIPEEKRGAILSMIYLPLNLAFVIGPFAAAYVATNFQVRDVFLVSAVVVLSGLLMYVMTSNRARRVSVEQEG